MAGDEMTPVRCGKPMPLTSQPGENACTALFGGPPPVSLEIVARQPPPSSDAAAHEARALGVGARVEHADGPAVARLAGQLRRAEDRGLRRLGHEAGGDAPLRRAADAARVEHLRLKEEPEVALRRRVAESKDVHALADERALLGEERLELAEIDDGRVDFDLPEVGIDRAGEGEVRGDAVLDVETRIVAELLLIDERLRAIDAAHDVGAADGVRHELERALAMDAFDAGDG